MQVGSVLAQSYTTQDPIMQYYFVVFLSLMAASVASGIPGAPSDVDIKSEHVQTMKNFVLEQFAAGGGSNVADELGELVSAKKQVVSGTLTTMTFKRSDGSQCEIAVWDQVWTKKREVTSSTCKFVAAPKKE